VTAAMQKSSVAATEHVARAATRNASRAATSMSRARPRHHPWHPSFPVPPRVGLRAQVHSTNPRRNTHDVAKGEEDG